MEMSLCHIQAVDGVQKATRCTAKDGSPTRQVEVHLTGAKKEHLDLGLWGHFKLRLFKEEPMRCFRCQKFGHHKATCHNPECCAICSGRHKTSVCIMNTRKDKLQRRNAQTAKGTIMHGIPNAQNGLRLIQTEQLQATTQPRREKAATLRRQKILVNVPSTSGASRIVSFAETLKGVQKRAPTPKPQRRKGHQGKENPPRLWSSHQGLLWRKIPAERGKARHISSSRRRR